MPWAPPVITAMRLSALMLLCSLAENIEAVRHTPSSRALRALSTMRAVPEFRPTADQAFQVWAFPAETPEASRSDCRADRSGAVLKAARSWTAKFEGDCFSDEARAIATALRWNPAGP